MQRELKEIADLALFARVVHAGGITRCAAALGMERTTVSRRISTLERVLGVKLLERTPKQLFVTDAGHRCLRQCELILESAENARSLAMLGLVVSNTEPIVVGAPPDIMHLCLDPMLTKFEDENSGIRVERRPVTVWTDAATEAVDIGIALAPASSVSGRPRTVAFVRQSVFASADYATRLQPVKTPVDLRKFDCIVERDAGENSLWRFERGDKVTTVAVNGKHVVSGLLEAREATLAGLGVSRLPIYLCESHLNSGQLVDLIPDVHCTHRDIVMVNPHKKQLKVGVAEVRIHLEKSFGMEAF